MKYDYQYEDPDYKYTDPDTGILRNKQNIKEETVLMATESLLVGRRLEELEGKPIMIRSADALIAIHEYIFQDIYDWAGKVRTVQISKQDHQFHPTSFFDEGFRYINELISYYRESNDNLSVVAKQLAQILDAVNTLHPFREGNGRTQREFIRVLALEKGYRLNLNPLDDESAYKRYMDGTIKGDVAILTSLIGDMMQAKDVDDN